MKLVNKLLLPVVILLTALTVQVPAQNFKVLHAFSASTGLTNWDGAEPRADLVLSGDMLYGATPLGGSNGFGTLFSVHADGMGFTVLHTFTGGPDGAVPNRSLLLFGRTLYGLVGRGTNAGSYAAAYSVDTNGDNFAILYPFSTSSDGTLGQPNGGLMLAGDTFYGTAYQGGINNAGTIFSLKTDGTFTLLHQFDAGSDGENPLSGLVLSGDRLYGTARNGGSNSIFGTVFSICTNGSDFKVLHTFLGSPSLDGRNPGAGLTLSGNTLCGTTTFGGTNGGGTVFSINTDGSAYTVLHSFNTSAGEGKLPEAGLVLRGNTLYGTTLANSTGLGGTIYSVNTDGSSFTTLYYFSAANSNSGYTNWDGTQPYAALAMSGNVLYGTASLGGPAGMGTVLSLVIAPQITNLGLAGTNLVLQGINGLAGNSYTLLASTNLMVPLNQWTPVATNPLNAGGNFTIIATNAVDTQFARRFYMLQTR